jgi:hypothetical protein
VVALLFELVELLLVLHCGQIMVDNSVYIWTFLPDDGVENLTGDTVSAGQ